MTQHNDPFLEEALEAQSQYQNMLTDVGLDEEAFELLGERLRSTLSAIELDRVEAEKARLFATEEPRAPRRHRPGSSALTIPFGIRS